MGKRIASTLLISAVAACALAQSARADSLFPVGVWFYWQRNLPDDPAQAQTSLDQVFRKIRGAGMNAVVADGLLQEHALPVLDAARRHGLKVILSCRFLTQKRRRRGEPRPEEAQVIEQLSAHVSRVESHPALYMHYTYDCPRPEQVNYLLKINQLIGKLAPGRPTFMACNRRLAEIVRGSKAPTLSWDNFPVGIENPPGLLVNYRYPGAMDHEEELQRIHDATPGVRHYMLIQAFDSPGRLRLPSVAELRLQVNVALLHGWTEGVLFYRLFTRTGKRTSRGMMNSKTQWQICPEGDLRGICERTLRIGRHLVDSRRLPAALVAVPPPLGAAEFQKGGERYALIVNRSVTAPFSGDVVLARPRLRKGTPWAQISAVEDVLTGQQHRIDPKTPTRVRLAIGPGDASLLRFVGPAQP